MAKEYEVTSFDVYMEILQAPERICLVFLFTHYQSERFACSLSDHIGSLNHVDY